MGSSAVSDSVRQQFGAVAANYAVSAVHASGADLAQLVAAAGVTSETRALDLGSGAGFPGMPIAFAETDARFTLCDSVQKRATFLERSEDHLARNKYDVVLVRAVSSVRENVRTLRKVRHSLKDLVMLKGPSWSREVRAGEREAERLGFKLDTVWEHKLPGEMGARAMLVYRAPGSQGG
jgi:16S rRNA (guanine527-N7)-methyltransferase